MTFRTLSALTWPSYYRLSKILISWPGNAQQRSGDGFGNTPTSAILTTPAGPGSLGLKMGRSPTVGLPPAQNTTESLGSELKGFDDLGLLNLGATND
jgi:hypothetical protein